jgi:hypothetical protein
MSYINPRHGLGAAPVLIESRRRLVGGPAGGMGATAMTLAAKKRRPGFWTSFRHGFSKGMHGFGDDIEMPADPSRPGMTQAQAEAVVAAENAPIDLSKAASALLADITNIFTPSSSAPTSSPTSATQPYVATKPPPKNNTMLYLLGAAAIGGVVYFARKK